MPKAATTPTTPPPSVEPAADPSARTLELLVAPVMHLSQALSRLVDPDMQDFQGREDTVNWLACELVNRVEELAAVTERRPRRWFTNMDTDELAVALPPVVVPPDGR